MDSVGVQIHFHIINKQYIGTSAGQNFVGPSWDFYGPLDQKSWIRHGDYMFETNKCRMLLKTIGLVKKIELSTFYYG
jgi:hypothetical protein